ncbi:MAG: glycosyltransferase family 39 protein [Elusimicrobia bacterium]|nr:glycosyltransferase family 39 protein [Elusimicrobiota bacterium]
MDEFRPRPRVLALSLLCLAGFLAWQAVALRSYLRVESRPPSWDQSIHLEIAHDYREALRAWDWRGVMFLAPKPGMPPFPPLHHLALAKLMGGADPEAAALWLNWMYLALLSFSLFALAWRFRPDETAVMGVVLFCASPAVQDLLHTQLVDLGLVAFAAAAYWALFSSEEFRRWKGTLAFGILVAGGMLLKWSFFSYMLPAGYVALKALGLPGRRLKVAAAVVLAAAGCGPWYWIHFPVLLPRLFQASADFAVPFWRGGAVLSYVWMAAEGLGPLFFLFALIGIFLPQFHRNWHQGWLLIAWVSAAFVFWTVVPNRQMRFLLPGLPALAIAGMGPWPRSVFWALTAVQLFTAVNFTANWIDPAVVPVPWGSIQFFPSSPAVREDWKIREILAETEKRGAQSGLPFANMTLVANDTRFNGPNFNWMAKMAGASHVRIRGVNNRLCELSRLVLLKTGRLGPESVISGLPEAAKIIQNKRGWFPRAYEEARRWPLPDGSEAVLYQVRGPQAAPVPSGTVHYQFFSAGAFEAADMDISLGPWDPARAAYRSVQASATEVQLRGLRLTGLRAELDDALFVPVYEKNSNVWGDVRLLKIGRLRIQSARVSGEAIRRFLEKRVPGLRIDSLELDRTARLRGKLGRFTVSAELSAELVADPPGLRVDLREARIGATKIPDFLLRPLRSFTHPFPPSPDTPFFIDIPGLSFSQGAVSIP